MHWMDALKYTYAHVYVEVREWYRPESGTEHLPQSLSPLLFRDRVSQ